MPVVRASFFSDTLTHSMRRLTVSALFIGAAACSGTTDVGSAGVPVIGSWSYAGQQVSPGTTALAGSLSFTEQNGALVTGTLDVVETDSRSQQRRLAGPFAGRTVDSTTLDFEVVLGNVSRRHVGRVKADSLTGTWVESSGDGLPTASGTFRAKRAR
jgi:hypothetical protein